MTDKQKELPPEATTEDELVNLMRNPNYWKKRDPTWLDAVTQGFKKLYPDKGF